MRRWSSRKGADIRIKENGLNAEEEKVAEIMSRTLNEMHFLRT
jgi:hypothetical protein